MKRIEFEALVQKVVEKTAAADEFALVQEKLRASAEHRRIFRESFLIDECLTRELVTVGDFKRVIPVETMMSRQRRRAFWTATAAAAAMLVLAAVLMRLFLFEAKPMVTFRTAPHTDWSVVRSGEGDGGELKPGDKIEIRAGTIELNFGDGATGIVAGPARLLIEDRHTLRMDHGSGRFHVPPEAVGFTVRSGRVEVVDLGTSFGVSFPADIVQAPEVHVFAGRVRVNVRGGAGERRELAAGEAFAVNPAGRMEPIQPDASRFYTSLPDDLPYVRFTMEPLVGGGLEVLGNHPAVASIRSNLADGAGLIDGVDGKAVAMSGEGRVTTNWEGILGERPRSVCAWIRCDSGGPWQAYQSIAGWGVPTIGRAGKFEMLAVRGKPGDPCLLRLSFDQFLFTGTTDLADGRWHHVAAVFDGADPSGETPADEMVRLYVDGVRESLHPRLSETTDIPRVPNTLRGGAPLMIGHVPPAPVRIKKTFRGAIDEVMVFDAALTEQRVREVARRVR